MKKKGVTLGEVLCASFLLGILSWLILQFLLPIILSSQRLLAGVSAAAPVERALSLLHADVYQASHQGLSFATSEEGWTLALVRRVPPSGGAESLWEKSLRAYRFHRQSQTLTLQIYPELKRPDGSLRLNGGEPLHFSAEELAALPQQETRLAQFVSGPLWASWESTWEFDYLPPASSKSHYLLSLAGDLDP